MSNDMNKFSNLFSNWIINSRSGVKSMEDSSSIFKIHWKCNRDYHKPIPNKGASDRG